MKTSDSNSKFYRRRLLTEQLEDRRLLAGRYAPAAGESGSTAIPKDDPSLVAWATAVASYTAGSNLDAEFAVPDKAIGPAEGTSSDAVSLGRGGEITLGFDAPIYDGIGPDFAVFENSFSDTFLELGFVEVSSDGVNFFRFENDSLTPSAVDAFGTIDPTDIDNLAGKYRQGFGTPFDLEQLAGVSPLLDTTSVTHVRLVDVVGDGSQTDTSGDPIYDPFPTSGSAGLDVDAVGVIHRQELVRDVIGFEDAGATLAAESAFSGPDPEGTSVDGPFDDTVVLGSFQSESLSFNNAHSIDFASWNQFAYANGTDTTTAGFTNQFSSFTGGGAGGSATFGIGFPDQSNFFEPPTLSRDASDMRRFESLMVTNTTYAALSMRDGDLFAKKFGGTSGDDPDYLRLTITGKDAGDNSIGTIQFHLADYRFADNSLDYIVDQWVEIDLRPIAAARSLEFSITSSDIGPNGINTPAFFAVDDVTLATPVLPISIADRQVSESAGETATKVRISRSNSDTSEAIDVTIAPVDQSLASVPTSVTIPIGQPYVEFPLGVVGNELVDGDRAIRIEASADGFTSSTRTLTIQDDDLRSLALTLEPSSVNEGDGIVVTVRRNDADVSSSLTVQLAVSEPSLLAAEETVTIAANQSSATFTMIAVDDQIDRPNADVSLTASAADYIEAVALVEVIDNDQPGVSIEVDPATYSESDAAPTTSFEDVGRRLAPESFYNGADAAGGFDSEGLAFNNEFDPMFGSWSGWSYSNTTDTATPGFTNQYSAISGGGAAASDTYAVATAFDGAPVPTIRRDIEAGEFRSIEITNTTFAALSMMQGDNFAKKFGGDSGDDPDFFLLTIEGFNAGDSSVGMIEFYLADFRFSDSALDYIVDQWITVDLTDLADAVELQFALSSSDVGSFGMNTPAYFAVDNISLESKNPSAMVTLRRNSLDVSADLAVTLTSSDPTEAVLPAAVTIPGGATSTSVPLAVVNDSVVDGDRSVTLGVAAASHASSSALVTITDDDVASLTLTVTTPTLGEADGEGRAVVHRNLFNTTESLDVQLAASLSGQLVLPTTVTIPAGARSVEFLFTVEDNVVVDGDRFVSVTATADGFAVGEDSVSIIDEDLVPPSLSLQLSAEALSELSGDAASELLVRRDFANVDSPLLVTLDFDSHIHLSSNVTIPAGEASIAVPLGVVDNNLLDGNRTVTIKASANGFSSAETSLTIHDDEVAGLLVSESDGSTSVSEDLGRDEFTVSLAAMPQSDVVIDIVASGGDVKLGIDRLVFSPSGWNQAQTVTVEGLPDLRIEENDSVEITLAVRADASNAMFASVPPFVLAATVADYQPELLRLGRDGLQAVLVEISTGIEFQRSGPDEIEVVGNDLKQDITIDELDDVAGFIRVDVAGGDDDVTVFGSHFTSLDGGDGHDRLIFAGGGTVDLAGFLEDRVFGFEEFWITNDTGLAVDLSRLASMIGADPPPLIRLNEDEQLTFVGDGMQAEPVMLGFEFAQVVQFGDAVVRLISPRQWQNLLDEFDVNQSGDVTALDALAVVNQLARVAEAELPPIHSLEDFSGDYYDVSGDGRITSLDALRVINEIARRLLGSESEATLAPVSLTPSSDFIPACFLVPRVEVVPKGAEKIVAISLPQDEAIRQLYVGDDDLSDDEHSSAPGQTDRPASVDAFL